MSPNPFNEVYVQVVKCKIPESVVPSHTANVLSPKRLES